MLGSVIVSCIMPWRNSFPCHRMCCGPDTLLWFALSVFRVADMIGIDGHVGFLPPPPQKKGVSGLLLAGQDIYIYSDAIRPVARMLGVRKAHERAGGPMEVTRDQARPLPR